MDSNNLFKKFILTALAIVVTKSATTALVSCNAVKSEGLFANNEGYIASQDDAQDQKQTIREDLDFMSEKQVKMVITALNDVFMKYLHKNGLMGNAIPIIIKEKPYLVTLYYIEPVKSGQELRKFKTCEIDELQNTEEAHVLFKNLNILSNYQQGYKNLSLDQAKDSLAELAVLFNLESADIVGLLTSSKNHKALINKAYAMSQVSLNAIFDGMRTCPNVKGEIVLDANISENPYLYIVNFIGENFDAFQSSESELEQ